MFLSHLSLVVVRRCLVERLHERLLLDGVLQQVLHQLLHRLRLLLRLLQSHDLLLQFVERGEVAVDRVRVLKEEVLLSAVLLPAAAAEAVAAAAAQPDSKCIIVGKVGILLKKSITHLLYALEYLLLLLPCSFLPPLLWEEAAAAAAESLLPVLALLA